MLGIDAQLGCRYPLQAEQRRHIHFDFLFGSVTLTVKRVDFLTGYPISIVWFRELPQFGCDLWIARSVRG